MGDSLSRDSAIDDLLRTINQPGSSSDLKFLFNKPKSNFIDVEEKNKIVISWMDPDGNVSKISEF